MMLNESTTDVGEECAVGVDAPVRLAVTEPVAVAVAVPEPVALPEELDDGVPVRLPLPV